MKKSLTVPKFFVFIFFSFIMLLASIGADAQYRINKEIYNPKDYTSKMYGPYSPGGASFASMLIPGTGQMLSGELGRGFIFLGAEVTSLLLFPVGFAFAWAYESLGTMMMLTSFAGVITTHIWASIDAGRVAKVNNLAKLDQQKKGTSWRLTPEFKLLPNMNAAPSLTLSFNF